ncbi:UDP-N-acetylglucosamine-N-acetylmuramylpentapeptide N-acetylglucosamine transferase [Paucidesulfovibrio gracilis DSM 16080]|uniref:UDP-N-acetylglucosamine--N-acetylmuramyl-(pentapeptide) pyrophosphoryl-undecaprenol N-acetylglucosamine transferase n=1 Tax=Paucidesulfovibrio gracilis DSM 16080 TaxID=1121449 RepID=A0A1T4W6P0_9BACT|nr:undecaprenyldiphospho-muramoylpentapeptide beta-N-acetylglucosaminyltransferase [Paucidesulfovibrio gracilis]SKA72381.1 UDP-N-acetylglucosamine-N-acetylmuramylpentapeptide N-acetylglucosamine transferase [Paucidesulfovibrio gracilis DSM 16080]
MSGLRHLVVTTGGTGGHIFPALAVAAEFKARDAARQVTFIGASGPEGELARKAELDFVALPARGVLGTGLRKLATPVWLAKGLLKALWTLRRLRPDAVLGFGGYAGFCPVPAAWLCGIPCAIHEQNSVPGAANRTLRHFVRTIFLSFEETVSWFPAKKTVLTGNPVRADIAQAGRTPRPGTRSLLVLGGSQGARALNDAVIEALPELRKAAITVRHQAGASDVDRVRRECTDAGFDPDGPQIRVSGFIDDMAQAYAEADLIFCRSGASTVFEAAAAGRPCIFVPYPHATHNHQALNARAMEQAGAARVIPQDGLGGGSLAGMVVGLLNNQEKLDRMAEAAKDFAKPDAAARIVDHLEEQAAKHKGRNA